jgi:hypothetical protein
MTKALDIKVAEYVEVLRSGNVGQTQYLAEMVENLDIPMTKEEYLELLVRAIFLRKMKDQIDHRTIEHLHKRIRDQNAFIICMFGTLGIIYLIKRFV